MSDYKHQLWPRPGPPVARFQWGELHEDSSLACWQAFDWLVLVWEWRGCALFCHLSTLRSAFRLRHVIWRITDCNSKAISIMQPNTCHAHAPMPASKVKIWYIFGHFRKMHSILYSCLHYIFLTWVRLAQVGRFMAEMHIYQTKNVKKAWNCN